jgi:hypothetical protein
MIFDDAEQIRLESVRLSPAGDHPLIVLNGVKGFSLKETAPPPGTKEFIRELKP